MLDEVDAYGSSKRERIRQMPTHPMPCHAMRLEMNTVKYSAVETRKKSKSTLGLFTTSPRRDQLVQ